MRRIYLIASMLMLAFVLIGANGSDAQAYQYHYLDIPEFSQEQMDAWQATAETYYTTSDPNYLLNRIAEWGYARFSEDIDSQGVGMHAPDFTLLDMYGNAWTLSDFEGKAFVFLFNGSWY